MVNLESVCDKVEKDNELGIWDENQDYGKILYFSSSRILVKKMGKRWSHRTTALLGGSTDNTGLSNRNENIGLVARRHLTSTALIFAAN
jgi:uncharacterized protein YfaA (DUF2138 family)